MSQLIPGSYVHSKSNRPYTLLYIALHSETLEPMAVYRAEYDDRKVWVRPARMWDELVEIDVPTGIGESIKRTMPRFSRKIQQWEIEREADLIVRKHKMESQFWFGSYLAPAINDTIRLIEVDEASISSMGDEVYTTIWPAEGHRGITVEMAVISFSEWTRVIDGKMKLPAGWGEVKDLKRYDDGVWVSIEPEEDLRQSPEMVRVRIEAQLYGITHYHPVEVRLRQDHNPLTWCGTWCGEVISPYFEGMTEIGRAARIDDILQNLALDDWEEVGNIVGKTPEEMK